MILNKILFFDTGQTLRFYCRNCETAVCSSCTDIEHRDHTTMRLNDAVDNQKLDLQRLIDKVNVQVRFKIRAQIACNIFIF